MATQKQCALRELAQDTDLSLEGKCIPLRAGWTLLADSAVFLSKPAAISSEFYRVLSVHVDAILCHVRGLDHGLHPVLHVVFDSPSIPASPEALHSSQSLVLLFRGESCCHLKVKRLHYKSGPPWLKLCLCQELTLGKPLSLLSSAAIWGGRYLKDNITHNAHEALCVLRNCHRNVTCFFYFSALSGDYALEPLQPASLSASGSATSSRARKSRPHSADGIAWETRRIKWAQKQTQTLARSSLPAAAAAPTLPSKQ